MSKEYFCNFCNYKTLKKNDYNKHLQRKKHLIREENHKQNDFKNNGNENNYVCKKCLKNYKYNNSYLKHIDTCKIKCDVDINDRNNKQDKILEVYENMIDVLKNTCNTVNNIVNNNIINNNNIVNNKTFNLNIFLNNTCKDALNIEDFFNSIQIGLKDLEKAEEKNIGYVKLISNQILSHYKSLKIERRPYHCCDEKRKNLYIKVNNSWTNEKPFDVLKPYVKIMSYKNMLTLQEWRKENSNSENGEHYDSTRKLNILMNILPGSDGDEIEENIKKVNDILIKESVIDKQKYLV